MQLNGHYMGEPQFSRRKISGLALIANSPQARPQRIAAADAGSADARGGQP